MTKDLSWGPSTEAFLNRITLWISEVSRYPGFNDWQKKRFSRILMWGEVSYDTGTNFEFDAETEKKQDFSLAYMELIRSALSIQSVEYYFRRYPFRDLPVSHDEHLSNICELLFSRIYQFREKLKKTLNLANQIKPNIIDVGPIIKWFDRTFREEISERNQTHHHTRYQDIEIEKISLMHLMAIAKRDNGWSEEMRHEYRKACSTWTSRVRARSKIIFQVIDVLSKHLDENADFLPSLSKAT